MLKLDGSGGRIQCNRCLKEKIVNATGSIEIAMEVTLGQKVYHIVLYDSHDEIAVDCRIDKDGKVGFYNGKEYVDSGARLAYPFSGYEKKVWADESSRPWYTVSSNLHSYEFGEFDFQKRRLIFKFDGKSHDAPLVTGVSDINKLELQTETVEPGTVIWLDHYKQIKGGKVTDYEGFPYHWEPMPAVPPGYPNDKRHAIKYRMKEHKWLEAFTKYGNVFCRLPKPVLNGSVDFEVMTPHAHQEVYFALSEMGNKRSEEAGGFFVMIFNGLWASCSEVIKDQEKIEKAFKIGLIAGPNYYFTPFDTPMKAENNKFYKVHVEWSESTYRLWIDGEPQKLKGSYDFPMYGGGLRKGVDTINLHPAAHVFPQGGAYVYSYWGTITLRSKTKLIRG